MGHSSPSTPLAEAPAWLGAVYSARRERTTNLVQTSIDTLQKQEKPVSITSVVAAPSSPKPSTSIRPSKLMAASSDVSLTRVEPAAVVSRSSPQYAKRGC